jgi:hypothetical protein
MHAAVPTRIDRAELARALDDVARADRRLAAALTACEAWRSGYCAEVVNIAADLATQDDLSHQSYSSTRERSLHAMQRALDVANPRHFSRSLDHSVSPDAIQALFALLTSQVRFHESASHLERRRWNRIAFAG